MNILENNPLHLLYHQIFKWHFWCIGYKPHSFFFKVWNLNLWWLRKRVGERGCEMELLLFILFTSIVWVFYHSQFLKPRQRNLWHLHKVGYCTKKREHRTANQNAYKRQWTLCMPTQQYLLKHKLKIKSTRIVYKTGPIQQQTWPIKT